MLGHTLEEHVGDVDYLGPVSLRYLFALGDRLNRVIGWLTGGKRYHYSTSVLVSWLYAALFWFKLRRKRYDFIFAPAAYTEFAFLRTNLPIVYCADSTLAQLIGYYDGMSALLPISKKELNYIEQRAINKASLLLYSSQWAAQSAKDTFGAPERMVEVVPFGANLTQIPDRQTVLQHTKTSRCELLFVGVEWKRKGGEIAVETLAELSRLQVDAHLTICGCVPPPELIHNMQDKLTVIPFLDKNDPVQLQRLNALYEAADFFILPTRAECAAIAFCEASAFGVPSFTTETGGIADFVVNNENGYRLSLSARGHDYAQAIKRVWDDDALYYSLREKSRNLYEQRLNWDAWGRQVRRVLHAHFASAFYNPRITVPIRRARYQTAS
ncbi:hypothetical protein ASU33_12730 [Solirubrum puertoriconensis]|uniref:Glycosyl transferase family 1 domain-containing protein n=2 Tax=Solirubrum puertoriconensis TaxID=1751427 RepID=A0A9X0HJW8_SOLP1|nr:hypothetical protein ASU33_12730 [Solirubrum puertoriconensis]